MSGELTKKFADQRLKKLKISSFDTLFMCSFLVIILLVNLVFYYFLLILVAK